MFEKLRSIYIPNRRHCYNCT